MNDVLLRGENLVKEYPVKKTPITGRVKQVFTALEGVSIELRAGETLGLVGESGSGKSTTGDILGDLQKPTKGRVFYKDKDISELSEEEYSLYRRNVQYIFQDPKGSMNPNYRVMEILEEPLITLKIEKSEALRREKARDIIRKVGLEEGILDKYPAEISGGQCQRIAVARALITEPEIIICDEAVSALDVSVQAQILNLLKDLQQRMHVAYLFISHDIGVVYHMADRICVMKNGRIVEEGIAEEVLDHPKHSYTRQLLECSFAKKA